MEPQGKQPKIESDTEMVLRILSEANGSWVPDLYRRTRSMVHSRISDLRRRGFEIQCKCFGQGDYRYRLEPKTGGAHGDHIS